MPQLIGDIMNGPRLRYLSVVCSRYYVIVTVLVFAALATVSASDNRKNHAPEKRQDNSFMFFGGWRPIRPGNRFHHGSSTGRYHDILSALPDSLDTSSTYYTSSLPSSYDKDIYNYYPKPAFKQYPKHNTPVYMETYKRQRRPQKHNSSPPIGPEVLSIDNLEGLDLQQLKNLQDLLLSAQPVALSHLNLPIQHGKKVELVEVSVHNLQEGVGLNLGGGRSHGKRKSNNRGGYGRLQSPRGPPPVKLEYLPISSLEHKQTGPRSLSKAVSVVPLRASHVEDVIDVKNIQIVEVPVPSGFQHKGSRGRNSQGNYGKRNNKGRRPHARTPSPKGQPQINLSDLESLLAHQQRQSRPYSPIGGQHQQTKHNLEQLQPHVAAELITVSDEQIKSLLKSIQIVDKGSQDVFRYVPLADAQKGKNDNLHVVVALPQQAQTDHFSGYGARVPALKKQQGGYGRDPVEIQLIESPKHQGAGGYQLAEGQVQSNEHNAAGYQLDGTYGATQNAEHQQQDVYQVVEQDVGHQQDVYQVVEQDVGHQQGGYPATGKDSGHQHDVYQVVEQDVGHQQGGYPATGKDSGHQQDVYQVVEQDVGHQQGGYPATGKDSGHQQGSYQVVEQEVEQAQDAYSSGQQIEHQQSGYQTDGHQQIDYQPEGHQQVDYQTGGHQQVDYQTGGHQQKGYGSEEQQAKHQESGYQNGHQQDGYKRDARGQAYIEVASSHTDEDGYRREPVLAVELKRGQTIEDAIQALDPRTLHQLGAHSKEGLEIEVVEVPVDEYASESRKQETVVSSKNSTVTTETKKT